MNLLKHLMASSNLIHIEVKFGLISFLRAYSSKHLILKYHPLKAHTSLVPPIWLSVSIIQPKPAFISFWLEKKCTKDFITIEIYTPFPPINIREYRPYTYKSKDGNRLNVMDVPKDSIFYGWEVLNANFVNIKAIYFVFSVL